MLNQVSLKVWQNVKSMELDNQGMGGMSPPAGCLNIPGSQVYTLAYRNLHCSPHQILVTNPKVHLVLNFNHFLAHESSYLVYLNAVLFENCIFTHIWTGHELDFAERS